MNPCPASGTPSLLPGGPLECGPPTPTSHPVLADSDSVLPAAPVNNLMAAPGDRLAHTPRMTRQQSRLCHPRESQHRTTRPAPRTPTSPRQDHPGPCSPCLVAGFRPQPPDRLLRPLPPHPRLPHSAAGTRRDPAWTGSLVGCPSWGSEPSPPSDLEGSAGQPLTP